MVRTFAFTAADPVGPPQRCAVVARFPLRLRTALVDEYPIVIASTNKAPGISGGLGTGMSKYRHPRPTIKLTTTPMKSFMNSSDDSSPLCLTLRGIKLADNHVFPLGAGNGKA